jgi:molecular chaperone DnaK (HSP70)
MLNPFLAVSQRSAHLAYDDVARSLAFHLSFIQHVEPSDVCPFSLGVAVEGRNTIGLISQGQQFPAIGKTTIYTTREDQPTRIIEVYQGESQLTSKNIGLGQLSVTGIPEGEAPNHTLHVQVEVDHDIF